MSFDNCASCDSLGGTAAEFHVGGMMSPTSAIMYDASMVLHSPEGSDVVWNHGLHTLAFQWFVGRFWLKAGIGVGSLTFADKNDTGSGDWDLTAAPKSSGNVAGVGSSVVAADRATAPGTDSGWAGMVAVGVELYQGEIFTLDLQLRGASVFYEANGVDSSISNASFMLGFNWY